MSGEPLFSSLDKYDSGSGWPSFTQPLDVGQYHHHGTTASSSWRAPRSAPSTRDSHLGHVFDDGPKPTGLRYCMNSASMRFIPVDKLEEEGYGEYLALFETTRQD